MSDNIKNIAILGATSHIAKGLIFNYLTKTDCRLFLYARNFEQVFDFLLEYNLDSARCEVSDKAAIRGGQDVIINCIGYRYNPYERDDESQIFFLTEYYDNLIINYLTDQPLCVYINFSSGAVYRNFSSPANIESISEITVNNLNSKDYYSISKINSEAKHRSINGLSILDIRVFAYFSQFINLGSTYFITEIIRSLKENKVFKTNSSDMLRDYSGSEDLFDLVRKCSENRGLNGVYDLYSSAPVTKFEIIDFFIRNYSLKYEIEEIDNNKSLTGYKNQYYSKNRKAEELGFIPAFSSIEVIENVSKQILGR